MAKILIKINQAVLERMQGLHTFVLVLVELYLIDCNATYYYEYKILRKTKVSLMYLDCKFENI